jgi:transposase InsO family protein
MGSVGDCFDNAMCESFFATLECELLNRRSFKTQVEARMAVFEFIEGWYNPHRRHSALDYLSPIDYERSHTVVPPRAAGKIEDNVIEANCIGEPSNQSPSPTPSTETG